MISSNPNEHIIQISPDWSFDSPSNTPSTPLLAATRQLAEQTARKQTSEALPHLVVNIPLEAMYEQDLEQELSRWVKLALPGEQRSKAKESIQDAAAWQFKSLDLRHLGLTSLPSCICNLRHLETLNLTGNKLSILPENIGNLSNLKNLYCSLNPILRLPNSFKKLEQLESLSLLFHRLETLPSVFSELKKLKSVEFRRDLDS